jgi:hypothetical protein
MFSLLSLLHGYVASCFRLVQADFIVWSLQGMLQFTLGCTFPFPLAIVTSYNPSSAHAVVLTVAAGGYGGRLTTRT